MSTDPASAAAAVLAPEEFLEPGRRLFIDTNVFMDTNPARDGALKGLFERCRPAILVSANPIVIPTKVVDELTKQSRIDPTGLVEDRVAAIAKARNAVTFIDAAARAGLVRKDLGDASNPYADDLFVEVFKRACDRYEMCLVTNDITLRLRVRLLAAETDRRLVAGVLTKDGLIEVESDQTLHYRGVRKLERKTRLVAEGGGDDRDLGEVESLTLHLAAFRETFRVQSPEAPAASRRAAASRRRSGSSPRPVEAFSRAPRMKPADTFLEPAALPGEGDTVYIGRPGRDAGTFVLGPLLGEGGEGRVFSVQDDPQTVVKVFDAEHRTLHRQQKLNLIVARGLSQEGITFPTGIITNDEGAFVGYAMPRAAGKVLQATVMRPARFKKTYPTWTKADLVDVCISFLEKVAYLHSLNILLGDINPKNVMVDANKDVWIIDADSWQLEGYPCPVGTPMFTAPSVSGDYAARLRTEQEELFAVATMLFMILITGQFPYARTGVDGGDFAALIREGKFAFQFKGASDRDQPEGNWKYMWSHLPFPVKRMFWNTFHRDGTRYARRPTAVEWLHVFREYHQFFGSTDDFDRMSHDVYPTRFRKKGADTPEYECAQCATSMIGRWQEETQEYRTPSLCDDCRRNVSKCADCRKSKAPENLRDGRCWECNRRRDYAACSNCSREIPRKYLLDGRCSNCRPVACRDCATPTPKTALTYGRCPACAKKAAELNPTRLCADCRQPFITRDHEAWFRSRGLDVPKAHQAIRKPCPPRPPDAPKPLRASTPARTATKARRPKKSILERLLGWVNH